MLRNPRLTIVVAVEVSLPQAASTMAAVAPSHTHFLLVDNGQVRCCPPILGSFESL